MRQDKIRLTATKSKAANDTVQMRMLRYRISKLELKATMMICMQNESSPVQSQKCEGLKLWSSRSAAVCGLTTGCCLS